MADVLINFVGSGEQLKPAEDALDNLVKKEGAVAETWQKVSSTMASATKQNTDGTSALAKSIESLGVAAKSADKAVIGGAYKQYLKEIQAQLGLTNKEIIAYIQNARKAAQASVISATTDQEAKEFSLSIQVMNDQLRALGVTEDGTTVKTQSFKAELAAAKLELAGMIQAGKQGTAEFSELEQKIGELTDRNKDLSDTFSRLGSDTKNIDGLISAASGVAGGFAAAQGAIALFGDESEDLQKALLKVNAAMSILQGLQALGNVLQKESAANLFLTNLFRKQNTVALVENNVAQAVNNVETVVATEASAALAVAEGTQVVATEAATVATAELNAVMLLNPAGILVASVLALIAAYSLLSGPSQAAIDNQHAINNAILEGTVHLDNYLDAIDHQTQKMVADAKVQGKTIVDLAQLEGNAGNERVNAIFAAREAAAKAFNESQADDEESIKAKAELYKVYTDLDKKYNDERRALEIKGVEFRKTLADQELKSYIAHQNAKVQATIAGSDAERTAQIESIKNIAAAREKSADFIALTAGEKELARAEDLRKINDLNLANYQHYLKGRTSAKEAEIAENKLLIIKDQVDTLATIQRGAQAEIDALKKRRKEALSDPTLNPGERRKIVAETNLAIAQLEQDLQIQLLNIKKAGLNAQLILAQKGTQEEFDAKIASIDNAEKIELAATELTQEQIDEIRARHQKQRNDTQRSFLQAQLEDLISFDNAQLDRFGITEDEKLGLTLKRLEEQRKVELLNAENNAAKIAEVNAKFDKQILETKLANIETVTKKQLDAFDVINEQEFRRFARRQESPDVTAAQKEKAVEQERKLSLDRLQIQFDELEKKKAMITDYDIQYQKLVNAQVSVNQSASDKIVAIKQTEIDRITTVTENYFAFVLKGMDMVGSNSALTAAVGGLSSLGTSLFSIFGNLKTSVAEYNKIIDDQDASDDAKNEARAAKFQAQKEAFIQAGVSAIQVFQEITNAIYAKQSQQRAEQLQRDLENLQKSKARELAVENLTAQQKADIEQKYEDRARQLKRQAFEADKRAKKSQALINAALGATLAFAEYPWPYSLIVAAITAGLAAIEIDQINAQNPGFKGGVIDINGPGTETSDDIPVRVSRRESIMTAGETKEWKGALLAMRAGTFPEWVQNYQSIVYPEKSMVMVTKEGSNVSIDYEKLGDVISKNVSKNLPAPVRFEANIDSDGLHSWMHNMDSITEFKNKRYPKE